MKILVISHSAVIKTYREKWRLLAARKDVELALLLPHAWPEAGQRVLSAPQEGHQEGYQIWSAPIVFEGKVKRHFYLRLDRYIRDFKPDIVHIEEEPYSFTAWQALQAAQKIGAAFIFFTWENLLERFEFPHQLIRNWVLANTDRAIAGDTEAKDLLLKAGYPAKKIVVIPQYGVNPKLFKKVPVSKLKKELKLGPYTVGYVGRLVPEKGIDCLLRAFAKARIKGSHLLIVGNGPLRESLEKEGQALGLEGHIHFVKAMGQESLVPYLNCMDTLVLPSLTTPQWKEQFGRVLIEAQACQIPVIGSDSGAIPEVIGKAGVIFPEGNVAVLAKELKKMAGSSASRRKLARAGLAQVLKLYTNQKIADQTYALYKGLLKG